MDNLLLQAFFPTFAFVIEIDRHIEILLLSNDCVIVPGLGGFMAHHVDARKDERDGSLLPPLRTIGFNPKLTLNDSLLAQSYVEAYDLSYPDAVKRIEDEVRELRQHLEKKGCFGLNDIGTISINQDGNMEFEPCIAGLLTPELYGLSNFEMKTLSELEKATNAMASTVAPRLASISHALPAMAEEEEVSASASAPVAVPASASAPASTPVTAPSGSSPSDTGAYQATADSSGEDEKEPVIDEESTPHSACFIALWRNVAVACIAVLAFLLIPAPLANNSVSLLQGRVDTSLLQHIMPKDQVTIPQVSLAPSSAPAFAPVASSTTPAATSSAPANAASGCSPLDPDAYQAPAASASAASPSQPHGFCIVLASRVTKKNARLYTADLQRRGYKAARVLDRTRGAKVVYGSYSTQDAAQQVLRQLNDKEEFAEAWIMKY